VVVGVGYVGMRGTHLIRTGDVNAPTPETLPDGRLFTPKGSPRPNPNFSAIELKTSDGDSWYNALQAHVEKTLGGLLSLNCLTLLAVISTMARLLQEARS